MPISIFENALGEGKVVFWGTKFTEALTDEFLKYVIEEKVERTAQVEEGLSYYLREDAQNKYLCIINMVDEPKKYKVNGNYQRLLGDGDQAEGVLNGYSYTVLVQKK